MKLLRYLKQVFLVPFTRRVTTTLIGEIDQWAILSGSLKADSFIVSAGVGRAITFEQDLVRRFGAHIVLLDPSPTGVNTVSQLADQRNIRFHELGLAGAAGQVQFGLPDNAEEGSFRKGGSKDTLSFTCTTLPTILQEYDRGKIDLLKIDVEGFEYEIIQSILDHKITVDQICVEIHHDRVIAIEQTFFDAARLIYQLAQNGYRVIYNKNMDFTFVRRDLLA